MIGILAGMGPRSTAPFIDMVVTECQRQYGARDDIEFPKIMICSQPAPFYEDRPVDHDALEAAIRVGLEDLERTGADLLAIACNTAHVYFPSLTGAVKPPLLDMVSLTAEAMPAAAGTLGLIAARPTVESEIYQGALAARGFDVVDAGWRKIGLLLRRLGVDTAVVACLDLSAIRLHAPADLPVVDAAECLASEIVRRWLQLRDS
ncbi:aspartate/glutamate racemase family protein [Streptomyces sp. NPDC023998]|uniref:aspartate/glutamate racemase family protein n=1 Tax=Streptomyces sp. NPDC023998 TaxID=3154597 RepID=UPI0033FFC48A